MVLGVDGDQGLGISTGELFENSFENWVRRCVQLPIT